MTGNQMKLKKVFGSDRKSIKYAEEMLNEIRNHTQLDDERFYNILIAVTEAVNNAIQHGNSCNPDIEVVVRMQISNSVLEIFVKDQGKGFDPEKVADPREEENLLKERGRGVFLIKELSDDVRYTIDDSGTAVLMLFNL